MDLSYILILFAIGFVGSFISGLVGIGGAIINFPLLLYIPIVLGFEGFTAQEVSSITAVQVFFATLLAILVLRKSGYIHKSLVIYMGSAIVLGSFIGGFGSKFLSGSTINIIYGLLAFVAAVMMFLPKKNKEHKDINSISFHKGVASFIAVFIGIASGIVGAAGAFITVPVMLLILKIPTRIAIASSLVITFLSSFGTTTGKLLAGHVLWTPTIIIVIASTIASPIGALISKKLNTRALQWVLSFLIGATAIKIGIDIFLNL
ncbi:sulfite exporter TauE/SafE family protein [Paenibacillus alginolyticus]|uniref:Probable membrane transporter protein n=1 Tax=Paenibacillus alginolyticus TaxID=59839 RepID=A0ABT4GMY7_9BACL|nr:sulfite exporter TauE/SafE family protein [Paenibacillus alginolyticus]MCY9697575.1 sulfite exporter TauE/SafE family protein [Paenibacillus alginolyticus]MEC0143357.1 sulfite exporter TauE/SafE family protein [Paenibacillus alginolyticus]